MKTKINIILFFLLSAYSINAQKAWTEYTINSQNNSIAFKSQYWTTDDIIVDGYTYTKVEGKDHYHGAIREENGKIYALLEYGDYLGSGEFLLYDFTVQVGDVIKSTAREGSLSYSDGITVIQIDEVILETGEKRKRFSFDITEPWIEGIGSTSGLFHDAMAHLTNYTVSYLVCFQQDNTPIYVNTEKCLDENCCEEPIAQNVFPESDAIWNISADWKNYHYGLSGDTIFEDKTYNKLYLLNDTTLNIDSEDVYVGGFRQEEKKVWFRPYLPDDYIDYDNPNYPRETLLYDFSKNVGDTIWHNIIPHLHLYYWTMGDSITASIIESIDIDDQGYKIYHSRQYGRHYDGELIWMGREDSWIEGIGSISHGLFWFLSDMTLSGRSEFHLACFKQGDEIKYIDKDICNSCFCGYESGILEQSNIPIDVVPENDCIRIKGEPSIFPCELKLFSPIGQLILEKRLLSDMERIPIDKETRGVYLYQVQKDKETISAGKIIIE